MRLFCYILLSTAATFLNSCSKGNVLKGEYAAFIGTYEWRSTGIQTGSGLTIKTSSLTKKEVNYISSVELNDNSEIIFYKDGSKLSKNQYRISDKENGNQLIIKLKGKVENMSIPDNKLRLTLSGDTVIEVDRFPFPAIDKAENYKAGASNLSNRFRRK